MANYTDPADEPDMPRERYCPHCHTLIVAAGPEPVPPTWFCDDCWSIEEQDEHDYEFQQSDDYDEEDESCPDCGGPEWVALTDTMLAECGECGGDG